MGSRIVLFYTLVILWFNNICLTLAITQNDDISLRLQLKFAEMEQRMAEQNRKALRMETTISEQNRQMAVMGSLILEQSTLIANQNTKLCQLESKIELSKPCVISTELPIVNTSSGVVFTRWGREDCPVNISTSVYNGTAGGSHWEHAGGAANRICMPQDPIWDNNKNFYGRNWGYVYGSSYQHLPDFSLTDYKVPCTVCRANSFSTRIMIPGRNKCYEGWTKAYAGELTSGWYGHAAANEYLCLDAQPQKKGNNTYYDDGVLFYPVRAKCGALSCDQYENDKLLTCVVCLK